jgi:hypothetical protein
MTTVSCGIAYDNVASYPIMVQRSYDDHDNDWDNDGDNHNSDHDNHNDDDDMP